MIVRLHDASFTGRIGHTEDERRTGCRVEVDVDLTLAEEGRLVAIEETVDYRAIHETVERVVMGAEHPLIEGLAHDIALAVLALGGQEVTIRVRKPAPPIRGFGGHVEVELTRRPDPPGGVASGGVGA